MKIAQSFHPLLGVMKATLRNRLHSELAKYFNDGNWIINQQQGFMRAPLLVKRNKKTRKMKLSFKYPTYTNSSVSLIADTFHPPIHEPPLSSPIQKEGRSFSEPEYPLPLPMY